MKSLNLFAIFFILILVSPLVLSFEFDNIKEYDSNTRTVTIENAFGIGNDKIATAQLLTPLNYRVGLGEQYVWEMKIQGFKNYNDFIKTIDLYDKNDNMKKISRDFDLRKKEIIQSPMPTYECSQAISSNGTITENCIINGTRYEDKEVWTKLEEVDFKEEDILFVRMYTNVQEGDVVEWIPTLAGKKIEEWAVWTANLNVNLVSYYKFDGQDTTGSGNIIDSLGLNNGTNNGADNVTGLLETAYNFSLANTDYINLTSSLQPAFESDFTIDLWINPDTDGVTETYFSQNTVLGDNQGLRILRIGTDANFIFDFGTTFEQFATTFAMTKGNWYYLTARREGTNVSIWGNGVLLDFNSDVGHDTNMSSSQIIRVGQRTDGSSTASATIDEIGVWDRGLSDAEIVQRYNSGIGISWRGTFDNLPNATLISPVNNTKYSSSPQSVDFTCYGSDDINFTEMEFYLGGSLTQTNSSGLNNTNYIFQESLTDGEYNWSCIGNDNNSQQTQSETWFLTVDTTPFINWTTPPTPNNNTNITSSIITVNVTLTETYFENVTFYLYNSSGLYQSETYTDNTREHDFTGLTNGIYYINSTTWTNTIKSNSTETRQILVDSVLPNITNLVPNSTQDYILKGDSQNVTWNVSDINLDSCWINYNGTNITVTCLDNLTGITIQNNSINILTFYANDTFGNLAQDTITWNYNILEISQTFNNMTTEGATETFLINFTKNTNIQISTVDLIYNGTSNSFPYSVSGNNVLSTSSITIPVTDSDVNITFYWNITLDDTSSITTQSNNQTIFSINVDNCNSFTNIVYNFTQYDEENQTILSGNNTIELQINIYDTKKTTILAEFSNKFVGVNPVQFCLESAILETVNYSSYVIAKYFVNATGGEAYSVEYYNILNQTIANSTIPIDIPLYNLKVDDTTKFRLTFRDDEYVLAPNILVQVHRQYIQDNDFKIVEIPLTDSNGQTVLNLVKDTIIYNFIMVNEAREIIGTFNSIVAFCSDFSIGDCTINLAPDSLSEDIYDYNEEFDISISDPSYDDSSKLISVSFVTGDLTPKNVRMDIVKNNNFGNRSVCSSSIFAASGTLFCNISSITDVDQFLFISTFVEGNLAKQDTTNLNSNILNFGTLDGAFYAFLLILFLITMFMQDRKILVISLGLGWVAVISLGLVRGKLIGFTSAGIWILISIAIFIWKLNKEDSP